MLLGLTRAGVVLVAIGGVLGRCSGVGSVHLSHWRYGSAWVVSATALYVVVLLVGGLGGRRVDDRISRAENYGSVLLVLVIVGPMVFKPCDEGIVTAAWDRRAHPVRHQQGP